MTLLQEDREPKITPTECLRFHGAVILPQRPAGILRALQGSRKRLMQDGHTPGRFDAVMQRCRRIERQAASLRGEMLWLAEGEGNRGRVDRALRALREQLRQAEALADEIDPAGLRAA
jgi:hypothetical protein